MVKARNISVIEISDAIGVIGLFQVTSEWEGFKKAELLDGNGCIILAPKVSEGMQTTFQSIFGEMFDLPVFTDMNIVAASPMIAHRLNEGKNAASKKS